jgi:hypothetical protein
VSCYGSFGLLPRSKEKILLTDGAHMVDTRDARQEGMWAAWVHGNGPGERIQPIRLGVVLFLFLKNIFCFLYFSIDLSSNLL